MKNSIFFLLILAPFILLGQRIKQDQVPTPVYRAFLIKFPNAKMVRWSRGEASYEVDFQKNEDNISAVFDNNGEWVSTQIEIEDDKIPASVKKSYSALYRVAPEDAERRDFAAGEIEYIIDSPDGNTVLYFSEKGLLLRKEIDE